MLKLKTKLLIILPFILKIFLNILISIYIIYDFLCFKHKLSFDKKRDEYLINEYKIYSEKFLYLKEKPINPDDSLIYQEKQNIIDLISKDIKRNISSIKRIVYTSAAKFGNILIILNKLIFFCEIIRCNEITLKSNAFWFIKNSIFLSDYNITINKFNNTHNNSYDNNSYTIYYDSVNIFHYFYKIKPKIRIYILKDEIINNLPKLNISKNDLYIHIRSGDIFTDYVHSSYAQPPFCFYTNILYNFNFSSIYLLSQDKNNPTINKLLSKFKNIIYLKNSLDYDLSCLINSYNLVGSISSFLNNIIILNSNLVNFYEYNLYHIYQKIVQYHYDLYEFKNSFTVYRMGPSPNYKNKMYNWKNTRSQRKLMIKEKCINGFIIIRVGN